jgi:thiol-disulfide isomerase/thioredoxin
MNKTILSIALVLANLFAYAQIPKDAISFEDPNFGEYLKTRKVPVVKGRISGISSEEIKITEIKYTIVTIFGGAQEHKIAIINADGNFTLELETSLPYQQIWLEIGKEKFYAGIYAHSDLFIEIDWQKAKQKEIYMIGDGVKYSGQDGEMNIYLNNYVLFNQKDTSNTYQKYIKQNPSKYAWIIENEKESDELGNICTQHWMLQKMESDLWKKINNHKSYVVSNDGMLFYRYLYNFISIKETATVAGKDNTEFCLKYYCQNDEERAKLKALVALVKNTPPQDSVLYQSNLNKQSEYTRSLYRDVETRALYPKLMTFIDSAFTPSKADFLKLHEDWQREDIQVRKKKTEIALASMKTGWCKDILNDEYQKTLSKIKEVDDALSISPKSTTKNNIGELILETPFGAKLYEVKSGKGNELLANLKSSFKGKAMLLDFWATWCGPCLSDLPHSKKLHAETEDLPLEYIYLCTSSSSSIEKWKNKIAELSISGTHIFVDEKIENELMGMFQASGFPSYRFIDSKGKYKSGAISWMQEMDRVKLRKLVDGK